MSSLAGVLFILLVLLPLQAGLFVLANKSRRPRVTNLGTAAMFVVAIAAVAVFLHV